MELLASSYTEARKRVFFAILFSAIISFLTPTALAQGLPPVVLSNGIYFIDLASHIEYLEDPEGAWTIEDVASAAYTDRFRAINGGSLKFGVTSSIFWFRFRIHPSGERTSDRSNWLLEINRGWLPRADLFAPHSGPDGRPGFERIQPVMADNHSEGVMRTRSVLFDIPGDYGSGGYFYLTLASQGPPLNVQLRLRTLTDYQRWATLDFFIFGGVYGILLVMTFYNFIIFLFLRDRAYLYYVLYILFMALYQFATYGHSLTFTAAPPTWLGIIYVLSGMTIAWASLFCRNFLSTKRTAPYFDRLLTCCLIAAIVGAALGAAGYYRTSQILQSYLVLTFAVIAILTGTNALAKGFRPAAYYLAAWTFLLAAGVLWAARGAGWLGHTVLITYIFPLATTLESILLSFALADRIRTLRLEKEHLQNTERRLLELSVTDGLTGLYNKRYMHSKLESEVGHARRLEQPLSLLMIDVDNFKKFNDTYGHPEGDRVLKALAAVLKSGSRPYDICCRYGGEEFVVILPGTDGIAANIVAERIRKDFAGVQFSPLHGKSVSSSVSIGLAELARSEDVDSFIRRADEALYEAKRSGKNRTVAVSFTDPFIQGSPAGEPISGS